MRYPYIIVLVVGLVTGLLTQFTNCSTYSDTQALSALSHGCETASCINQSADLLEIATPAQVMVRTSLGSVDLGGDCNEGGFFDNQLIWDILNNGAVVASCAQNCGQCLNGRFQINIFFNSLAPLNTWQIRVELKGYDQGGMEYTNPTLARRLVQVQTF